MRESEFVAWARARGWGIERMEVIHALDYTSEGSIVAVEPFEGFQWEDSVSENDQLVSHTLVSFNPRLGKVYYTSYWDPPATPLCRARNGDRSSS